MDLPVRLAVRGQTVRLAPDLELAAFRIVQAALNNVGHPCRGAGAPL